MTHTAPPLPRHRPARSAAVAGSHQVKCFDEHGALLGELPCPQGTHFVQLVTSLPAPPPGSLRDRLTRGGHGHRLAQICTQACPAYNISQADISLP